jgi:uncharacterized protein YciI
MKMSRRNLLLVVLASASAFLSASALVRSTRTTMAAVRPAAKDAQASPQAKRHFLLFLHNEVKAGKVKVSDEEFRRLISEHFLLLKKHLAEGRLMAAGPRVDEVYGFGLLEVSTAEEAEAMAKGDPCVKAGVFRYELHEVRLPLFRAASAP